MILHLKHVTTSLKDNYKTTRYYYFGKYITRTEAEKEYIKGAKLVVDCIEPYPIAVRVEMYRIQLVKELYETGKSIQTQASNPCTKADT